MIEMKVPFGCLLQTRQIVCGTNRPSSRSQVAAHLGYLKLFHVVGQYPTVYHDTLSNFDSFLLDQEGGLLASRTQRESRSKKGIPKSWLGFLGWLIDGYNSMQRLSRISIDMSRLSL